MLFNTCINPVKQEFALYLMFFFLQSILHNYKLVSYKTEVNSLVYYITDVDFAYVLLS